MGLDTRTRALLIGAISRDYIGERGPEPGGAVYHAGISLARLGARVRVVTRVDPADAATLIEPLEAEGVWTLALPSAHTTTYALDYGSGPDRHELVQTSDPIHLRDLPPSHRSADLIQLGPLHRHDLAPGLASELSGRIGLDVQGLLRARGPEGTRLEPCREIAEHLRGVSVVKANEDELPALVGDDDAAGFARRHGIPELLVTRGARGASLITNGDVHQVEAPAVPGHHAVGAGDVFLAAYLLLREHGHEPAAAARGACRAAAAKIQHGMLPKGTRPDELCG